MGILRETSESKRVARHSLINDNEILGLTAKLIAESSIKQNKINTPYVASCLLSFLIESQYSAKKDKYCVINIEREKPTNRQITNIRNAAHSGFQKGSFLPPKKIHFPIGGRFPPCQRPWDFSLWASNAMPWEARKRAVGLLKLPVLISSRGDLVFEYFGEKNGAPSGKIL